MKIGADNLLYVLQWGGNGKVKRYQLDGTFVDDFTSVGVAQSIGLDWDASGNLYVSSYTEHNIRHFDAAGNDLGLYVDSELLGPTNIWFVGQTLYVSDYNGTSIKEFGRFGVYKGEFITGLNSSEGVDFFPNGNVLIGNGGTSSVFMYDLNGVFIEEIISSGAGGLLTPNAVVIREIAAMSISGSQMASPNFVLSSIGADFQMNPDGPQNIETVEVYNILGARVSKTTVNNSQLWDAKSFSEGIYFMVAKTMAGKTTTQKVIVRH